MTKAKNAKVEMKGKIPNILLGVKRKRSKAARVQELTDNKSIALSTVLKGSFDDTIVWDLPGGCPPDYTSNPLGTVTIEKVQPTLGRFVVGNARNNFNGGTAGIRAMARQRAWVEMLETMHEDEAAVLIAMVDNTINKLFPSVCYDLAAEAFPELF
tara:strand:- start:1368 stop:1835 length:468 start_codon:yes stop_codon:yes gene_type:complete